MNPLPFLHSCSCVTCSCHNFVHTSESAVVGHLSVHSAVSHALSLVCSAVSFLLGRFCKVMQVAEEVVGGGVTCLLLPVSERWWFPLIGQGQHALLNPGKCWIRGSLIGRDASMRHPFGSTWPINNAVHGKKKNLLLQKVEAKKKNGQFCLRQFKGFKLPQD